MARMGSIGCIFIAIAVKKQRRNRLTCNVGRQDLKVLVCLTRTIAGSDPSRIYLAVIMHAGKEVWDVS